MEGAPCYDRVMLKMLRLVLTAARPQQWVKNLLVFAALVFSGRLLDAEAFLRTVLVLVVFCLWSSSVYLINDLTDIEVDREHPQKKNRPLASGQLKKRAALVAALTLLILASLLTIKLSLNLFWLGALYLVLNLLYSIRLKSVFGVDVLVVAGFYVFRAIAGGIAIEVEISHWLLLITFFGALFLVLGKRSYEANHNEKLPTYSPQLTNQFMAMTAGITILSYTLYTQAENTLLFIGPELILTIPLVVYGFLRYLKLLEKEKQAYDPTNLILSDQPLLLAIFFWGLLVITAIYL